jgi:hypothetical protein
VTAVAVAAAAVVGCVQVHQGNGTASIFEGDARVITFDMHGDNNYPWRTRMKSDYDVPLQDNIVSSPNPAPLPSPRAHTESTCPTQRAPSR